MTSGINVMNLRKRTWVLADLRAFRWESQHGKPAKLRTDGRIGNQMRGLVLDEGGMLFLFSAATCIGVADTVNQCIITEERFALPDAVLQARMVVTSGRRLREPSEYSAMTEMHKRWFHWEFARLGCEMVSEDGAAFRSRLGLYTEMGGLPTANFGRESRYAESIYGR
jgi:hypothetical protein